MSDGDYVIIEGRRYPSLFPPGTHWAIDEAWKVLDLLKDGVISDEVRAFLSGAIAAAFLAERRMAALRKAEGEEK